MSLTIHFKSRDFKPVLLAGIKASPLRLSWSAFGGPDRADLRLEGAAGNLFRLANLLRCPVEISDPYASPAWWGFVDRIVIHIGGVQVSLSLLELFNKVRVCYSFISPDNHLAEVKMTDFVGDAASQAEYGIREKVLHRVDLDDVHAESLRDTFLAGHAWPESQLSHAIGGETDAAHRSFVELHCSGWFKTLAWMHYQNQEGFFANYGPGPGSFEFANASTRRNPGQLIRPNEDSNLAYAYFMLRKVGSHARNFQCRVFDAGTGTAIAYSDTHTADELDEDSWSWVRFQFDPPFPMAGGSNYYVCVRCTDGTNAYNYFSMRIDESQHLKGSKAVYYNGSSFVNMPSTVIGFGVPDCYFRVLCSKDTGAQLAEVAAAGGQFIERITSLSTGIRTSPYCFEPETCLQRIEGLMMAGTSQQRLVLARVSPQRHLDFYEQPSNQTPTALMDLQGRFYSLEGKPLAPYQPPVGQYVYLSGTDQLTFPWDRHRFPACFVHKAAYHFHSGAVQIKPFSIDSIV